MQKEIDQAIKEKKLYFIGECLPANWYEAFRTWLPLAEDGDPKAQYNVGRCFSNGNGTDQDLKLAFEWYSKSVAQNDPRAIHNLALMYQSGKFVAKDEDKAFELIERAAHLGEGRAIAIFCQAKIKPALTELKNGNIQAAKSLFQTQLDEKTFPLLDEWARSGLIAAGVVISGWQYKAVGSQYVSSNTVVNGNSVGGSSYTEYVFEFTVQNNSPWDAKISLAVEQVTKAGRVNDATVASLIPAGGSANQLTLGGYKYVNPASHDTNVTEIRVDDVSWSISPIFILKAKQKVGKEQRVNEEKKSCFVVTACTGSPDNITVETFRQFRDNTLTHHRAGRSFIAWYYRKGPSMADWISTKPMLRKSCGKVFDWVAKLL